MGRRGPYRATRKEESQDGADETNEATRNEEGQAGGDERGTRKEESQDGDDETNPEATAANDAEEITSGAEEKAGIEGTSGYLELE